MQETLVSIMPLVENRDYWKRRALIAEAINESRLDARADQRMIIGLGRQWKEDVEDQLKSDPTKVLRSLGLMLGTRLVEDGWAQLELDEHGRISLCVNVVPGSGMSNAAMVETLKKLLEEQASKP
jgi:hypothetical protein